MQNKLAIVSLITLAFFITEAKAQNIKCKTPTSTNLDVQCDASGYLITAPSGGATNVHIQDGVIPAALSTVAHPNVDNIDPALVYDLNVLSLGQCLNAGGRLDRIRCGSQISTNCQCVAPTSNAYFMVSATAAANAATNPIFERISVDGTNPMDSTHPLVISATNAANTAGNPIYVSSISMGTYSPTKTTTINIAGALVDVLASVEILGYSNFCITLKNNDGANSLTDAAVFQSPDASSWESLSWTGCDTLAPSTSCSYCVSGNAYRYVKAQAKAAALATVSSLDAWITANVH